MLPIMMMSSMASSCSSSVSSPAVMAFFFWTRVAAFFGALMKGLNPFNAVANVGKKIGKGLKTGVKVIGKGLKTGVKVIGKGLKTGVKAIGKSAKRTGRVLKKVFKIKKIRIKRPRWCFSPETPIKLQNGETVLIKNLKLGDILINGSIVTATMQIRNENDPYYRIDDILVTGSHHIESNGKFIRVSEFKDSVCTDKVGDVVNCLITSDHKIPVGNYIFWDWEDQKL